MSPIATGTSSKKNVIYIRDFYDWEAGGMNDFMNDAFNVAADILNEMHYAGIARDFPVIGTATY